MVHRGARHAASSPTFGVNHMGMGNTWIWCNKKMEGEVFGVRTCGSCWKNMGKRIAVQIMNMGYEVLLYTVGLFSSGLRSSPSCEIL